MRCAIRLLAALSTAAASPASGAPGTEFWAVLSEDPQSVAPERLREVTIQLTIIDGEIAWQA